MTVNMKKINKKIPGHLPPPPKSEIDGKINDLSSKTIPELLEIRDRQVKLLNNKAFISRLADNGAKIKAFHDKVVNELNAKQEEEHTCRLFGNLNLNLDKQTVQQIEWEGKVQSSKEVFLDSDDDSEPEDVMQILTQNTSKEKKINILPPEIPLITHEDLLEIGEIPHVKYLVQKTEQIPKPNVTRQFKPYKTTITNVHDPEKEGIRTKHKHWEVTSATPPPSIHGPVKTLLLEESLKLQQEYNFHIKELEAQNAAEKLLARTGITMGDLPDDVSNFGKYREVSEDSDDSDPEGSDKEVHDEEPERGGVIFTVMK